MNPPARELWLSACISVGVHVTAVWVAAQLGAGALRRMPAKAVSPVLEVIVTEPKPVLTPPVPLPVAPIAVAPAPAARTVGAKSVAAKAPEASVENPAPPKTPPPVAKATVSDAPIPKPKPKPEQTAPAFSAERVVISTVPPQPVAPVTPVASPPVAKVEHVVPPRAVVASVVAPHPVTVAVTAAAVVVTVPSVVTSAPPGGVSVNAPTGRNDEGPGTLSLPQYRSNPAPVYPESARRRRQEGVVWLVVEVSERGDALSVAVGQTSGHRVLDEAAMTAVQSWKFEPARQGNRLVVMRVEVPVRFHLKE